MLRKENGITMITLTITIVVMLILTFTFSINVNIYVEIRKRTNFETDLTILREEIIQYYSTNKTLPIANKYINISHLEKNINDNENYYVIDLSLIDVDLNYGKDFYSIEDKTTEISDLLDIYIINEQSHTIYYPRGIKYDNGTYYTIQDNTTLISDLEIYGIEIKGETIAIVGENITLTANVIPGFIQNTGVTWSSSDEEIATINGNGLVTAIKPGEVTITATSNDDENISATYNINIKNPQLASIISQNNYGDNVNYSVTINETTFNNWKIFYKENDEIFIICTDYIPTNSMPIVNAKFAIKEGFPHAAYWSEEPSEKPIYQTLNNNNLSLFKSTLYTLDGANDSSKCVSTLLNTDNWQDFVNTSYADLAIGSPTIEMWCESWNSHEGYTQITLTVDEDSYGYKVNNNVSLDGLSKTDLLYFPELPSDSTYIGYRFASTQALDAGKIMHIEYNGVSGKIDSKEYNDYNYGIRPVIHLKSKILGKFNSETNKWDLQ